MLRVNNLSGFGGIIPAAGGGDLPDTLSIWTRYKSSTMSSVGDGNSTSQWDDISGNNRHATQATSARRPIYRAAASGLVGNTSAFDFLGDDTDPHCIALPDMSGLSEGFIAAWLIADTDTNAGTGNIRRIWELGSSTDGYYKYTDGGIEGIYETFGTTARKTTGDTSPTSGVLTNWHSYMVASASGAWTNWINNVQHFTTGTNTVGFPASPLIGGYPGGTSGRRLANKKYAEMIICSAVPTSGERNAIQAYFESEYS